MQRDGHAAAGARRSHRPRHRPVRPRGRVHRARDAPAAPRLPGAEDRVRAHHDARRRPVRGRGRRPDRRHHHRAPPAVQPQRDLQGRHPSALLLPAGAQARGTSPGAGDGRHQRRRALLPRHRLRAARRRTPRKAPAAAPAATRRCTRWSCTPTAFEQAGALDKLEAFASLNGPASTACRCNEGSVTLKRDTWTIPPTVAMGEHALVPLDAGQQLHWKML